MFRNLWCFWIFSIFVPPLVGPVWPSRYYILNARFFLPPTPVVDTHTHTHTHAHTPPPHRYAHTHTLTHLSVPQSWMVVIMGLVLDSHDYGPKVSSIRKYPFGKSALWYRTFWCIHSCVESASCLDLVFLVIFCVFGTPIFVPLRNHFDPVDT